MASAAHNNHPATMPATVELMIDGKLRSVSIEKAFALGHRLWRQGRTAESTDLLERLHKLLPTCRPICLLLARGWASLRKYQQCHRLLHESFTPEEAPLAAGLHDAFVMSTVGDPVDAMQDLINITQEHTELPTICLIAGDLYERFKDRDRAGALWKMAYQRANRNGLVAYSASCQIASLPRTA